MSIEMPVSIGILRAAIRMQPDAKQSGRSLRWTPQRQRDQPPQRKGTRLPQAPSPIQPERRALFF